MLIKRFTRQLVCTSVSLFFCLIATSTFNASEISYQPVADNPTYKAVVSLPFKKADQKISYGDDSQQYGLLWLPEQKNASDTLVVFIHGGCWLSAYDIKHTYASSTAIAKTGFPVWSIEYRRTGETGGGWPTTFEDIKSGITAITKLEQFDIKPKNIVIAGHSAGGHLALLSGANINTILPGTDLNIRIAGLAAITDIKTYVASKGSCQSAGAAFIGGKVSEMPEAYEKANPSNFHMPIDTALFQGKQDAIVPIAQSTAMTKGEQIQKIYVENAGHFDWVHPGTAAFRKFLDYLNNKH